MRLCELRLQLRCFDRPGPILERLFGALLGLQCRCFVQVLGTQRRVGKHGHQVRLNFERAARRRKRTALPCRVPAHGLRPAFSVVSNGA